MPLYRQEQIFAQRHQIYLPRKTLARWVELAVEWLQPIYENIRTGVLAGCWAHVRRKFFEELEAAPRRAGWILRQVQPFYTLEARLRESKAGPRLRQVIRANHNRPIIERLERILRRFKASGQHLQQSPLGTAMAYALGQWTALLVYLKDGHAKIDNNLVENAIRPTAVGKKNWLLISDAGAGQRSAILYTVIESCRRRETDPYAYLREVLTRLPHLTNWQIPQVTPAAWKQTSAPLQRQAA